jgi:hypothetical protein
MMVAAGSDARPSARRGDKGLAGARVLSVWATPPPLVLSTRDTPRALLPCEPTTDTGVSTSSGIAATCRHVDVVRLTEVGVAVRCECAKPRPESKAAGVSVTIGIAPWPCCAKGPARASASLRRAVLARAVPSPRAA